MLEMKTMTTARSPGILGIFKPKDTFVCEESFQVTLPGVWTRRETFDAGRRVLCGSEKGEKLTVSLMLPKNLMSPEDQRLLLVALAKRNRQTELDDLSDPLKKVSENYFGMGGGSHSVRHSGVHPSGGRRFGWLALCNPTLVGTFSYEVSRMKQAKWEARMNLIFGSARIV